MTETMKQIDRYSSPLTLAPFALLLVAALTTLAFAPEQPARVAVPTAATMAATMSLEPVQASSRRRRCRR